MTISPKTKAWLAMAFTTFMGGVLAFAAPRLSGGIPPQSDWPSIAVGAVVFGLVALWHRLAPSPLPEAPSATPAAEAGKVP